MSLKLGNIINDRILRMNGKAPLEEQQKRRSLTSKEETVYLLNLVRNP